MEQIKCYCGHTTYCDCGPLEEKSAVEWLYETLWEQNNYSLPSNILEQRIRIPNYGKAFIVAKAGLRSQLNIL
jgi:hypothetical protein